MASQELSRPRIIDAALETFRDRFRREPAWAAIAPGRVNLIGEHTDYNAGFVLPMAIERHTAIVAGPSLDGSETVELCSRDLKGTARFSTTGPIEPGEPTWANYVRGVVAGFLRRGVTVPGFSAAIATNVPLGGGLSSSAALEIATATLLEQITGHWLEPLEKALLGQWAEHNYADMPCGLMDQYTSVFGRRGHLVLLDCQSQESRLVPLDDPTVAILIADTRVKHTLTGSEYPDRRAQCEQAARTLGVPSLRETTVDALDQAADQLGPVVFGRARHVVGEIARTIRAAELATRRDWMSFGTLMYESHRSLRDDYEVSCPELDAMVEAARSIGPEGGVLGSRMTGGGFGGCTVSLVRADRVESIVRGLHESYARKTGIEPFLFATWPDDGATAVPLDRAPTAP